MPRFYCPELSAGIVHWDDAEARHALQSLRLRSGDRVELFDGAGCVAVGELVPEETGPPGATRRHKKAGPIEVRVTQLVEQVPPLDQLTLVVAACKGARLDWLVEKCTELGVTTLHLTEFARSVVHAGAKHVEKLQRTAIEACKQCGRNWLPTLRAGMALREAIVPGTALFVAHPDDESPTLATRLAHAGGAATHVTAVVGPEGGLTDEELALLAAAGGRRVRLATHILRVETAAVAIAAQWAGRAWRSAENPTGS